MVFKAHELDEISMGVSINTTEKTTMDFKTFAKGGETSKGDREATFSEVGRKLRQ